MKLYLKISFLLIGAYLIGMFIYQLIKTYQAEFVLADELILIFYSYFDRYTCLLTLVFGKKSTLDNHTKSIVYAAICIAMSFALSYIRFSACLKRSITFVYFCQSCFILICSALERRAGGLYLRSYASTARPVDIAPHTISA